MKIDALALSWAGDKYLDTPYSRMDCQAFVEQCMADCGYRRDLAGSNTWFRECLRAGWAGTPEECIKVFGSVPKGALLFILEHNGKEPGKYRTDGIGNASHMGIKTGRGKGAIHSSSTKKCVAESEFHDKTIRNGGWNRVGLLAAFDYGKTVNWLLDHIGIGSEPTDGKVKEGMPMTVTVTAPEGGGTVNLRKRPGGDLIDRIQTGAKAQLLDSTTDSKGVEWSKISVEGLTGWMMAEFLVADEAQLPAEEEPDTGKVALYFTTEELRAVLPILESAADQISKKVGRG